MSFEDTDEEIVAHHLQFSALLRTPGGFTVVYFDMANVGSMLLRRDEITNSEAKLVQVNSLEVAN